MSEARETWPGGCILSGTTQDNGDPIYYDLKPVSGGSITLALYTDERCIQEYQSRGKNDPITIENVIGNILVEGDGSGDGSQDYGEDYDFASEYGTLEASLAAWDSAFDIFKFCQPCVAHDLENYGYSGGNQGDNYGKYNYGYDDDAYSYNGGEADYDVSHFLVLYGCAACGSWEFGLRNSSSSPRRPSHARLVVLLCSLIVPLAVLLARNPCCVVQSVTQEGAGRVQCTAFSIASHAAPRSLLSFYLSRLLAPSLLFDSVMIMR